MGHLRVMLLVLWSLAMVACMRPGSGMLLQNNGSNFPFNFPSNNTPPSFEFPTDFDDEDDIDFENDDSPVFNPPSSLPDLPFNFPLPNIGLPEFPANATVLAPIPEDFLQRDLDGDGVPDAVIGARPGSLPYVTVALSSTGQVGRFLAYDPGFTGGVNVAVGRILPGNRASIVTGAGSGGGPHVKIFTFTGSRFREDYGFMAYDPRFSGGVNVATGNFIREVPGDRIVEIVTGAGAGGGPHVRIFSILPPGPSVREVVRFETMAFNIGFAGGVFVAAGDLTGDRTAELVVGAGPGGGPHVRIFNGNGWGELASFFPYDSNNTGGVRVGVADVNGNGTLELLTFNPSFGLKVYGH